MRAKTQQLAARRIILIYQKHKISNVPERNSESAPRGYRKPAAWPGPTTMAAALAGRPSESTAAGAAIDSDTSIAGAATGPGAAAADSGAGWAWAGAGPYSMSRSSERPPPAPLRIVAVMIAAPAGNAWPPPPASSRDWR
jgi:hypothetical protein